MYIASSTIKAKCIVASTTEARCMSESTTEEKCVLWIVLHTKDSSIAWEATY